MGFVSSTLIEEGLEAVQYLTANHGSSSSREVNQRYTESGQRSSDLFPV